MMKRTIKVQLNIGQSVCEEARSTRGRISPFAALKLK